MRINYRNACLNGEKKKAAFRVKTEGTEPV